MAGIMDKRVGKYKRTIVSAMKGVNTYKEEFNFAIMMLAKMMVDYDETVEKFKESGGEIVVSHTNKIGAENAAKNPYYLAIETLRKDILTYQRELGLTPESYRKILGKDKDFNNEEYREDV